MCIRVELSNLFCGLAVWLVFLRRKPLNLRASVGFALMQFDRNEIGPLLANDVTRLLDLRPARRTERQDNSGRLADALRGLNRLLHGPDVENLGLRRDKDQIGDARGVMRDVPMNGRAIKNDEIGPSIAHGVQIVR